MRYNHLIIEVTRKCNLICKNYCMRGNSQNKDIDIDYIDKLFNNDMSEVINVLFTGGEPTLNDEAITYTINKIIDNKINVISITLVTNGQIYNENIIKAFKKFNDYNNNRKVPVKNHDECIDKWASIYVSVDKYHKDSPVDVIEKYKSSGIKFGYKTPSNHVLKSGLSSDGVELESEPINIRIYNDCVWDDIYLTVNGNLSSFGDGSYDYLDENASIYKISDDNLERFAYERCNIKKSHTSRDIKKKIKKYKRN